MTQFDQLAHIIQLAIAPAFLFSGLVALLNVLSGRLARVVDRSRVLEASPFDGDGKPIAAITRELAILARRGRLIYRSVIFGTASAFLVCLVIGALFIAAMTPFVVGPLVAVLFVTAMLSAIVSLAFFLREVFFAFRTFQVGLPPESLEGRRASGGALKAAQP